MGDIATLDAARKGRQPELGLDARKPLVHVFCRTALLFERVLLPDFNGRTAVLIGIDIQGNGGSVAEKNPFDVKVNVTNYDVRDWQSGRAVMVGSELAKVLSPDGKLTKDLNIRAAGKMQTHAAGSEVNMDLLADLAVGIGADAALAAEIRAANTARHVLELSAARGLSALPGEICRHVVDHATRHAGGGLAVDAELVDFDGRLLGRFPPRAGGGGPDAGLDATSARGAP